MRELLSQASTIIPSMRHLSITRVDKKWNSKTYWDRHAGLLQLFRLFDTVETLHVGGHFTDLLPPMLKKLSNELVAEVLPALHLLNLECTTRKFLKKKKQLAPFIEKRQIMGRPPLIIVRKREDFERLQALTEICEMEGGHS